MTKVAISTWPERYRHVSFWWATVGGVGLLRPAPGTWGSVAGLVAGYLLFEAGISLMGFFGATLLVTLLSVWAINQIEAKSGIHDAPEIVMDEVAGQWVALLPFFFIPATPAGYLVAFLLFRLFDIWKPWPIGPIDKRVTGGFGVMADDLVAGLLAAAGTWLIATTLF